MKKSNFVLAHNSHLISDASLLNGRNILAFWGKARPSELASERWHPLVFHSLDVAACGLELLERRCLPFQLLNLFGESWQGCLGFLLALHDIGKLSKPFLAQSPEHWPKAILGPYTPPSAGFRHDAMGLVLLKILLDPDGERKHPLKDLPWNLATILLTPFVGHHGRPVVYGDIDSNDIFGPKLIEAGHDFLDLIEKLFKPLFPSPPNFKAQRRNIEKNTWALAGLTVLADWIGSNQNWFPYRSDMADPVKYWNEYAVLQAQYAIEQAGLISSKPSFVTGYRALTGKDHVLSPVQLWAEEVKLPAGPVLVIIEDMTGSGKTEAGLILAHRLIAEVRARGLYVALPTMATANAMYTRLANCYRRLFDPTSRPWLVLAHGATALHQGFRDSVVVPDSSDTAHDHSDMDTDELGEDEAGASCAAWLADSRRKAFLADVGVGTIDQALLAVLPAKYQSLRLFGLSNQVLVIDEAHAYDRYMLTELEVLLEFQAALGGSAIVLSATLPITKRQSMAAAFSRGLRDGKSSVRLTDYPLTTLVAAGVVSEHACATRHGLARELSVSRLADAGEAVFRIVEAVRAGAAVAWVRNTVDESIAAVELLRAEDVPAELFHARYAMGDRLEIEDRVVRRFGKDGDPFGRPGVLVATQVVEQSLDLDFDLMVSDLAPIDLLLQRAGRLWRHERGARPVGGPHLLVLSPDPAGKIESNWCRTSMPGTSFVYDDHGLLWRSAEVLFRQSSWRIPEDVRMLVEAVYDPATAKPIPPGLERKSAEASGKDRAGACFADANLLKVDAGYHGTHTGWAEDTRVPTRLGEATTTLRLARWSNGDLAPWCADGNPHQAWSLSEVSVRSFRAGATPALRKVQAAAAKRVRVSWTRHDEEKLLVPLVEAGEGVWAGKVIDKKGQVSKLSYTKLMGLQFDMGLV
ncbi:MAG: CRISPR-associated helicase Cas3' [Rhodospirillaceae bacterium]